MHSTWLLQLLHCLGHIKLRQFKCSSSLLLPVVGGRDVQGAVLERNGEGWWFSHLFSPLQTSETSPIVEVNYSFQIFFMV